jgi:hypothetical protein
MDYMENKIVVIATHRRFYITRANLETLKDYKVVLVVSDTLEANNYKDTGADIVMAPNFPLGAKWQAGIDHASKMDPSHIIIAGSDDILAKGFINRACRSGYEFTGLRQWYILSERILYHLQYLAAGNMPLGGGRVYSKSLLEKVGYKIFDTKRFKLLDDLGWGHALSSKYQLLQSPEILAIKGNWPVMNRLDLNHPNVKLLATYAGEAVNRITKEKFNYDCNRLL